MADADDRRGRVLVVIGGAIVAGLALVAALAPLFAPYDPRAFSGESLEAPSSAHLLGTDGVGHDVLSQLIWGARPSLTVAVGATVVALAVGLAVGVTAGLLGGTVDVVLMRVVDVFLALPGIPLVIVIAALAGPGPTVVILVTALALWAPVARILRAQTLSLRSHGYIAAAQGFGGRSPYVIRRHLVPALGPLLATGFVSAASVAVGIEAGLAFIGVGDPLSVSWGTMLNRALNYQGLYDGAAWLWWVLPAGLAVTLAILGFAFVGVGLEPRLNRRWRRA